MFNASQAIELFLKAMLAKADPEKEIAQTHNIHELANQYEALYPDPAYKWEILFRQPPLPGNLTTEQRKYLKDRTALPGIQLRYPLSKGGFDWAGEGLFNPVSFSHDLRAMLNDFNRLSIM